MEDTIAAISTAPAPSGIGIVRISGPGAVEAADRVFRPFSGRPLSAAENRKMIYGELFDRAGAVIDRALAVVSRGPSSYTGEDCVELQCHGSPVVLSEGLAALFTHGVRLARAGEFTRRAFLNGRLDLVQAEAVADLIEAETPEAARNAAGQLGGAVSRKTESAYDALLDVAARLQAAVDYPEEEVPPMEQPELAAALEGVARTLWRLLRSAEQGQFLRRGVRTVLLGRPNTGKSSLLNALAGYDRAIVSSIPGTTRDTVEETVRLGGVLLRLTDTAGLRETDDPLESMGVARSRAAAETAELCILVLDGSEPLTGADREAMDRAAETGRRIAVINKSDLPQKLDASEVEERFSAVCRVSALREEGLETLADRVRELFGAGEAEFGAGEILTNSRQTEAVNRALEALESAENALRNGLTADLVLLDVEESMAALGELTGRTIREDIAARIFDRFCVGK